MTKRARVLWLFFLFAAIVAILISFYCDASVKAWMDTHKDPSLKKLMRAVSKFGDWPEHVALGLAILGIAWWRKSKSWMRIAVAMILACALAGAVTRVVKVATGRPRPSVQTETVWTGPSLSSRYHAFPSGHTAASMAFFSVLAITAGRFCLPLLLLPALVAFSRMYVAAHYLSDVVCATFIGLLCAFLVTRWVRCSTGKPKSKIAN